MSDSRERVVQLPNGLQPTGWGPLLLYLLLFSGLTDGPVSWSYSASFLFLKSSRCLWLLSLMSAIKPSLQPYHGVVLSSVYVMWT